MEPSARRPLLGILFLLLVTDLGLIGLHIVHMAREGPDNSSHSLEYRWGYGEFFQHLKEGWLVLLLVAATVRTRKLGYAAWTLLFVFILFGDKYKLHGRLGAVVTNVLNLSGLLGSHGKDAGELLVTVVAGCMLLGLILYTTLRADVAFRRFSFHLLLLLLLLAFFCVGIDLVHELIQPPFLQTLFGVLEEAGELCTLSVIVVFMLMHDPTLAEPDSEESVPQHRFRSYFLATSRRRQSVRDLPSEGWPSTEAER